MTIILNFLKENVAKNFIKGCFYDILIHNESPFLEIMDRVTWDTSIIRRFLVIFLANIIRTTELTVFGHK